MLYFSAIGLHFKYVLLSSFELSAKTESANLFPSHKYCSPAKTNCFSAFLLSSRIINCEFIRLLGNSIIILKKCVASQKPKIAKMRIIKKQIYSNNVIPPLHYTKKLTF